VQNLKLTLRKLLRVSIALLGLFLVALAVFFLLEPVVAGATLGIGFIEPYGLAALRGDFTGCFGAAGILCLYGAYRRDPNYLIAPLLLMVLALGGRLLTFVTSGHDHTMWTPIVIELVIIKLLIFGRKSFARSQAS
jgi:hypothetical protein